MASNLSRAEAGNATSNRTPGGSRSGLPLAREVAPSDGRFDGRPAVDDEEVDGELLDPGSVRGGELLSVEQRRPPVHGV